MSEQYNAHFTKTVKALNHVGVSLRPVDAQQRMAYRDVLLMFAGKACCEWYGAKLSPEDASSLLDALENAAKGWLDERKKQTVSN